jgi:lipoate---protein ligase
MKLLDVTLETPAENLACDEALLDLCEEEEVEVLRFWESRQYFVVVGYGNHIESEVNMEECRRRGVPILRRCSGGGTVVQGPGCLNYGVTLCIREGGPLTTVVGTNRFVMERNRVALERLLGTPVSVQGHTDLAIDAAHGALSVPQFLKFSGNAQRRRRSAVLFHGTILHAFDILLVEALLTMPSKQPEYRNARRHSTFVTNLSLPADRMRDALRSAWQVQEKAVAPSIGSLLREKYGRADWHLRHR